MKGYCIISHSHKFIYIPIAKVGCTTILNRIAEIIHGTAMKKLGTKSHRDVHSYRKKLFMTSVSEISYDVDKAAEQYSSYFKFAFVRNPYERIHSCFVDKLSLNSYGFDTNLIKKYKFLKRGMPFSDFLKAIREIPVDDMDEHFRPQYCFLPDSGVDFIGKLENINVDWKFIEDKLNFKHKPLPIYNKTQDIDYYDPQSENLVFQFYKKDFEQFEYVVDRPPKNVEQISLPIQITTSGEVQIHPFKNVFIEKRDNKFLVSVTDKNSILIVPYFKVRAGKGVSINISIFASKKSQIKIYYNDKKDIEFTRPKERSAEIVKGENQLSIKINDEDIGGKLRVSFTKKSEYIVHSIHIYEHTLPWLEDKNDLTETNKNLFDLPDYAQDHKNLFSMVNYASLYLPILDLLSPKQIFEIGCDKGNNSEFLLEYCRKNNVLFTIIDPVELPGMEALSSDHLIFIQKKSVDHLKEIKNEPPDVIFIDGDHNYETVFEELTLIDSISHSSSKPVCVFLHDTSWPWAYRNLYYDPLKLDPETYLDNSIKGVSPYNEYLVPEGLRSPSYASAVKEGGADNGVKKALEDFLSAHQRWESFEIKSLYGLTILWLPSGMTEKQQNTFLKIKSHFDFFKEFLSILEWNRITLSCQVVRNAFLRNKERKELTPELTLRYILDQLYDYMRNLIKFNE